jgi:hypothetical protein
MILILDHRSDSAPIAPLLLSPEPRLRKCSSRTCLRRLGVFVPVRKPAAKPSPSSPTRP